MFEGRFLAVGGVFLQSRGHRFLPGFKGKPKGNHPFSEFLYFDTIPFEVISDQSMSHSIANHPELSFARRFMVVRNR